MVQWKITKFMADIGGPDRRVIRIAGRSNRLHVTSEKTAIFTVMGT